MNHRTALDLEVTSSSWTEIGEAFDRLPFEPALPRRLAGQGVKGGRYCSIAGQLAAHVSLQGEEAGRATSLFVTADSDVTRGLDTQPRELDGFAVEAWEESGLFFVLVRDL